MLFRLFPILLRCGDRTSLCHQLLNKDKIKATELYDGKYNARRPKVCLGSMAALHVAYRYTWRGPLAGAVRCDGCRCARSKARRTPRRQRSELMDLLCVRCLREAPSVLELELHSDGICGFGL